MADKRKQASEWRHPTFQRVPDEARRVLGRKNRIVHVRVSESEYEALVVAAQAAGTTNVSIYVRGVLLEATNKFLVVEQQQLEAEPVPTTQTASADAKSLDDWLFTQSQEGPPEPMDDLEALLPAVEEPQPPALVAVLPLPAAVEPSRARPTPLAAPEPVQAPPSAPESLGAPPVVTPEIATKLDMLAQLREIMGDDGRVGATVRHMLDGRPKPR